MIVEEIIEKLEVRMQRLIAWLSEKRRPYFDQLKSLFTNRAVLLYGPRGTGKTTFLLSNAKENDMLYISADDLLLSQCSFYDLANEVLKNYSGIIIDEVHALKDWSLVVKNLYDSFPNKKIWLSDSSSVFLRKGIADLSRRFVLIKLPIMSLREYVYFETGKTLPKFDSIFEPESRQKALEILKEVDVLTHFRVYRENGTRPFYVEGNFREKMINVVEKTLYYDVPHLIGSVAENHFGIMRAILHHLLFSKIPTINVEAMCRDWGIGKPKFYELLNALQSVGLINIVHREGIEKPHSKGAKMFLSDPAMYYVFEGEIGNFREAFLVAMLKEKGKLFASKDETKADFVFDGRTLEVGGKNKKGKNADFVIRDDVDVPIRNIIPLWMLGMLW